MSIFGFLFICICISAITGCEKISGDDDLLSQVNSYYILEQNEQWEEVYEQRVSKFRRTTLKSYYLSEMNSDNKEWKLLEWEVASISRKSRSLAEVIIQFSQEVPESFMVEFGLKGKNRMHFTERTIWQKEGGKWMCRVCGIRMHLPLNGDV